MYCYYYLPVTAVATEADATRYFGGGGGGGVVVGPRGHARRNVRRPHPAHPTQSRVYRRKGCGVLPQPLPPPPPPLPSPLTLPLTSPPQQPTPFFYCYHSTTTRRQRRTSGALVVVRRRRPRAHKTRPRHKIRAGHERRYACGQSVVVVIRCPIATSRTRPHRYIIHHWRLNFSIRCETQARIKYRLGPVGTTGEGG